MTGVPPDSLGVQKSRLEEKNSVEIIFAAGRCRFGLRFLFFSVFFCLVWPEKIAAHQHKKCDGRFANRHAFLFLFSTFRFFFAPTLLLLLFLLLHLPSFFFHRLSVSSYAAPTPNAMDAQECVVSFFQQFVTVISHCSFCDQRNTR